MDIRYRLFEENDLAAVRTLWEENTTWGPLTAEMFNRYMVEWPLGPAGGVLAIDDASGEIVGQFAFVPSLVQVADRQLRAFRPAAPIIAKRVRFSSPNPLKHPAAGMYLHAVKALRARGDGLIYMVPDPRWMRFFRMFPGLVCGKFPLWSIPLPFAAPLALPAGLSAAPMTKWDGRVDRLWELGSRLHGCQVVRDAQTLSWRTGTGEYRVTGIHRGDELIGVVAARAKGDRQWLICDLLFADADDALIGVLAEAVNQGNEAAAAAPPERPIHKAAVLVTPIMERAARALGFTRDAYDFPLVIQILDRSISAADLAPDRWFVSAND
ncbi:MAG: hypothetical protein M3Q09_04565 [Gemmatimonadota bacterium]|nr:hypothetical protein [Gemmatimonadota bacterium]